MRQYTHVNRHKNLILTRGYEDGKPFQYEIEYKPYLFARTNDKSAYKTVDGESVRKVDFESIYGASDYIKRYSGVSGHKIYGLTDWEYLYIYENYQENFEYDFSLLNVVSLDIETKRDETGYGDPQKGDKPITMITMTKGGKESITFGTEDYDDYTPTQIFVKCHNEIELLRRFIRYWNKVEWLPDVVATWNGESYDIPYIINRIRVVLGESQVEKLSPFGVIRPRTAIWVDGSEYTTYEIVGVPHVDYMVAYKKFSMSQKESYKLNSIAEIELGEKKIDYSEYGDLENLYEKNYNLFVKYSIQDSFLLDRLEDKLHYIEQMVALAYVERINIEATLSTVKPWDILIHNYLMDKNIVIPPIIVKEVGTAISGGYVKEPTPGLYEWVGSVDFTSLYPSLIMQYNISPDKFYNQIKRQISLDEIMNENTNEFTEELTNRNLTMAMNGCLFNRDGTGFFPAIIKKYFDQRKVFKKKMLETRDQMKKEPDNKALVNIYHKYNNIQTAYKLIGNSGYGALLNKYFRWFDPRFGEAVTMSGQITIQYSAAKINEFMNGFFKTDGIDYVIYGDTDSIFVDLKKLIELVGSYDKAKNVKLMVKFMEQKVVPYINKSCRQLGERMNAHEIKTEVKLEKICDKAIFKGKKRYILNVWYDEGTYFPKPERKITGMETVRSTTPKISRMALEEAFRIIIDEDQDVLYRFLSEFKEEFFSSPFEIIGSPSSVKGLMKYSSDGGYALYEKGTPFHVRASLVYNDAIKKADLGNLFPPIVDGDKIKYCYLMTPNPFHENVIAIKDGYGAPKKLDIERYIDYNAQFEKAFLKPLRDLVEIIGWKVEKVYTLEDAF